MIPLLILFSGLLMFDKSFSKRLQQTAQSCVRWVATTPVNEGISFYKLNRAKNTKITQRRSKTFSCPGQNSYLLQRPVISHLAAGKVPGCDGGRRVSMYAGAGQQLFMAGFIPQAENPHIKMKDILESCRPASRFLHIPSVLYSDFPACGINPCHK